MIWWDDHADMGGRMPARLLRTITVAAVCLCNGAIAVANERPRHAPAPIQESAASSRPAHTLTAYRRAPNLRQNAARTRAADRDPYADPAAPYKADRLSSRPDQPILDIPGQTTVLTRQVSTTRMPRA